MQCASSLSALRLWDAAPGRRLAAESPQKCEKSPGMRAPGKNKSVLSRVRSQQQHNAARMHLAHRSDINFHFPDSLDFPPLFLIISPLAPQTDRAPKEGEGIFLISLGTFRWAA
jgi:hypothetical protein